MKILFACAAEVEAKGLQSWLRERGHQLAILGVGPTRSSHALTLALQEESYDLLCLFGVAGAYPQRHRADAGPSPISDIGQLCLVQAERLGDEGVQTEDKFLSLEELKLVQPIELCADTRRSQAIAKRFESPMVVGNTVSTCSGQETLSRQRAEAAVDVESMEGAAVALVCQNLGVPWVQVRAISNWTGDRRLGQWNLERALETIDDAIKTIVEEDILK